MEEYIAYREVDSEHDYWSERLFLFKNRKQVEAFFNEENADFVALYTDGTTDKIENLDLLKTASGIVTQIEFKTKYAGKVKIVECLKGYVIS